MQSGTLHMASSLFSIFHKASSMVKLNLVNILSHRGNFVKDGKYLIRKQCARLYFASCFYSLLVQSN